MRIRVYAYTNIRVCVCVYTRISCVCDGRLFLSGTVACHQERNTSLQFLCNLEWELNSFSIISQYYLKTQIMSSAERPSTSGAEKPSTSSAEKPSTSSAEKSRIGAALLNVAKALSPLKTRKSRKCTSCTEYRESLKEKSEKNLRLQREKQQLIKQAAAKERVRKAKVVNQTVKRKEATIKKLTERIADSEAEQEFENCKEKPLCI